MIYMVIRNPSFPVGWNYLDFVKVVQR